MTYSEGSKESHILITHYITQEHGLKSRLLHLQFPPSVVLRNNPVSPGPCRTHLLQQCCTAENKRSVPLRQSPGLGSARPATKHSHGRQQHDLFTGTKAKINSLETVKKKKNYIRSGRLEYLVAHNCFSEWVFIHFYLAGISSSINE